MLCSCEIEKENSFLVPNDDNDDDDDYNIKLLMDFLSTSQASTATARNRIQKSSHVCIYWKFVSGCLKLPCDYYRVQKGTTKESLNMYT